MTAKHEWYWVAEFASGDDVVSAARRLRELGYREMEIFSPFEVPGAAEALELERPRHLPRWVLLGGLFGAASAYALQWYVDAVSFPINVGGRPLRSAPAFVPVTFEAGVLFGAFAAVAGLLVYSGLPRLWRPVFEVSGFERTSVDRYWLALDRADPTFEAERSREDLAQLDPLRIERVGASA